MAVILSLPFFICTLAAPAIAATEKLAASPSLLFIPTILLPAHRDAVNP
jgi:hypothetical protein